MKSIGYNLDGYGWIPLACFSWVVFTGCAGVVPLPFVVISETLPLKVYIKFH